MKTYEDKLSTKDFYHILQQWVGDRVLVDKSPHYALDSGALKKAEADFRDPLYIHLTCHPSASVRSFINYHMEQIVYLHEHGFSAGELAELVWTVSHQNITSFLQDIPQERQFRIAFETLVTEPEEVMRDMCNQFDLEFHAGLIDPYENIENKI